MWASKNGHLEVVRTLLEYGANVEAKEDKVRNQMMMMLMILMMFMMSVINDKDKDYCRY